MSRLNLKTKSIVFSFIMLITLVIFGGQLANADSNSFIQELLDTSYYEQNQNCITVLKHDISALRKNSSTFGSQLQIGTTKYTRGFGSHAPSHLRLKSNRPLKKFIADVGVDINNSCSLASIVFIVRTDQKEIRTKTLRYKEEPFHFEVDLEGSNVIDMIIGDAGNGVNCDHADWANAKVITEDGDVMWLDDLEFCEFPQNMLPFSFIYGGRSSEEILGNWQMRKSKAENENGCMTYKQIWTEPANGLRVIWEITKYPEFNAVEWLVKFENTGSKNSAIIENWQDLDIILKEKSSVKLHHTNGAPSTETDFEHTPIDMQGGTEFIFGGGNGRSSNKDFPFFKIETPERSLIYAVGWSGQWQSKVARHKPTGAVQIKAGLEKTHFRLYPGESVRSCRILLLDYQGVDTWQSNSLFRRLLYKHFVAKRADTLPPPTPYSNTCFTRGGGWLNECNEENQISLINAYAPLGLEAVVTDAGWFEGGWPAGAGNWTVRKDAYPNGMAPVALAARKNDMIYGLWFEPERVVPNTEIHQKYPQWCLKSHTAADAHQFLLNFGLEEVQDYFLDIVGGFMKLPGFNVYRQDFNMDPLEYWRANDEPDRQGITEMKYITGLYNYWDKMAKKWPDAIRIECSSGGRRIDLETIKRMHIHQKSDYWFRNLIDQASLWGLSQYLPNNTVMAPINRLDDYTFHSVLPCSLCIGWIADAPDFNYKRAKELMDKYIKYRHLLTASWYPLLPYSRSKIDWIGSQYYRPDLDEGIILVFRRESSEYISFNAKLRGLNPKTSYRIERDTANKQQTYTGKELMRGFEIRLEKAPESELIHFYSVKK